jgi:hypothetical protein
MGVEMNRRSMMLAGLGLPFAMRAALAKSSRNAGLLILRASLDKSTIKLDGEFAIACSLEARKEFCRVFAPLSWGKDRGFELSLVTADGKTLQPKFPQQMPPPSKDKFAEAHFHELDVGESVSFRTKLKAKDIFPGPGSYKLYVSYVPEPGKADTKVMQAVLFEGGAVEVGPMKVKVV